MHKNPFTPEESVLLRYLPEYARAIERWNTLREHVSILAHNIQAAHVRWLGWECEDYADEDEFESDQSISDEQKLKHATDGAENLGHFDSIPGRHRLDFLTSFTELVSVRSEYDFQNISHLNIEVDFQHLSEGMGPGRQQESAELVAAAYPRFADSSWNKLEDHDNLRINSHWGFKRVLQLHWDRVSALIPDNPHPHPWCPDLLPCLRECKLAIEAVRKLRKETK